MITQNKEQEFEQRLNNLDKELKKKFNFKEILIGLILVILLIGGSYAVNYYLPQNNQNNQAYYAQGAIDIYSQLLSELTQCKSVPLILSDNETVNAVLVECLNQGEGK